MLRRLIRRLLSPCSTEDEAYITIVYPTRGEACLVHDSLTPTAVQASAALSGVDSMESYDLSGLSHPQLHHPMHHGMNDGFCLVDIDPLGIHPAAFEEPLGVDWGDGTGMDINPTTGLPMLDGCMIDVGGNPLGHS